MWCHITPWEQGLGTSPLLGAMLSIQHLHMYSIGASVLGPRILTESPLRVTV